MEDSTDLSSMNRSTVVASKETAVFSLAEESGWTSYFEDFCNHKERSLCCSSDSSSMVSDAVSFPPRNSYQINHIVDSCCSSFRCLPQKLTFKRTRAKEISLEHDSLEDTASSPVNSPMVSDLRPKDMNSRKITNDQYYNFNRNCPGNIIEGSGLEEYKDSVETSKGSCDMNFSTTTWKSDRVDWKKRGLCLVPMSVLVNSLG